MLNVMTQYLSTLCLFHHTVCTIKPVAKETVWPYPAVNSSSVSCDSCIHMSWSNTMVYTEIGRGDGMDWSFEVFQVRDKILEFSFHSRSNHTVSGRVWVCGLRHRGQLVRLSSHTASDSSWCQGRSREGCVSGQQATAGHWWCPLQVLLFNGEESWEGLSWPSCGREGWPYFTILHNHLLSYRRPSHVVAINATSISGLILHLWKIKGQLLWLLAIIAVT